MKEKLDLLIKYLQGYELSNNDIEKIYQNKILKNFYNDLITGNIKKYNLKELLDISKEIKFISSCCDYFLKKGYEYKEIKYYNLTIDSINYLLKVEKDVYKKSRYKIFIALCFIEKYKLDNELNNCHISLEYLDGIDLEILNSEDKFMINHLFIRNYYFLAQTSNSIDYEKCLIYLNKNIKYPINRFTIDLLYEEAFILFNVGNNGYDSEKNLLLSKNMYITLEKSELSDNIYKIKSFNMISCINIKLYDLNVVDIDDLIESKDLANNVLSMTDDISEVYQARINLFCSLTRLNSCDMNNTENLLGLIKNSNELIQIIDQDDYYLNGIIDNTILAYSQLQDLNYEFDIKEGRNFIIFCREKFYEEKSLKYGELLYKEGLLYYNSLAFEKFNLNKYLMIINKMRKSRENGLIIYTENYAMSYIVEGNLLNKLVENVIDEVENLNKALFCFKNARKVGLKKKSKEYAKSFISESVSYHLLAEIHINERENLYKKSLNSIRMSRKMGLTTNDDEYYGSFLEESIILVELSYYENNSLNILEEALTIIEKIENKLKEKKDKSTLLMNKGVIKQKLANYGLNPITNLSESLELFKKSEKIFGEHSYYSLKNLSNKSKSYYSLGKYGYNSLINFNLCQEICEKIIDLSELGESDYIEAKIQYYDIELEKSKYVNIQEKFDICNDILKEYGILSNNVKEDIVLFSKIQLLIAEIHKFLGDLNYNYQEEYENAITLFKKYKKNISHTSYEYIQAVVNEINCILSLPNEKNSEFFITLTNYIQEINELISLLENYNPLLINLLELKIKCYENIIDMNINVKNNYKNIVDIFDELDIILYKNIFLKKEIEETIKLNKVRINLLYLFKEKTEINKKHFKIILTESKNICMEILKKDKLNIYCNFLLSQIYYNLKYPFLAYKYLKKSINEIESDIFLIKIPEIKEKYNEKFQGIYDLMIEICISLNKTREAFKFSQLSKNRLFIEELINYSILDSNSDNFKKLKEIHHKINFEEEKITRDNYDKQIYVVNNLKNEFNKILLSVKEEYPKRYQLLNYKYVKPQNIRKIKNKTVIDYYISSNINIFIINGNEVIVKTIEVNKEEFFKNIIEFMNSVQNCCINDKLLRYFYNILIKPINYLLKEQLIIIPHSILYLLPFQAFKNNSYMVEKYEISIIYSLNYFNYCNNSFGKEKLVIGNPTNDLIHSEEEAKLVSKILNSQLLLNNEVTLSNVKKNITNKKIIHYSGHSKFDEFNHLFSYMKLSDSLLRIIDIMNLNLKTELFVLSSCESGKNTINSNENKGFVRYLHIAGVKNVIASLWEVDDLGTKKLFENFYNETGLYSKRLQKAQIDLIKKGYNSYIWAPFQFYGID